MVKAGADESKIKIIGVFFSVVVEAGVHCLKVHIYDIDKLGKPSRGKSAVFLNIVQTGGGQPMFKNYAGNCRVFWRSFNNMKFA